MLIGVMSDSHGDAAMTARAVRLLEARGAAKLIHCGDICGENVLDELAGHDCAFVWGNCDVPSPLLKKYVAALRLACPQGPLQLDLAGKRIGVFHGHEPEFRRAIENGQFDYIFYGHTHRYADTRVSRCRVINPGALFRAKIKTVALLDLKTDDLKHLRLDTAEELTSKQSRDR